MPSFSPLTTALLIVLAVAFAGAIIAFVRDRGRFRGYTSLTTDALRLGRTLKGDVFRDGADLVISGAWQALPVQVRFSNSENTPGLDLRVGAPSGFTLSVMPGRSANVPGRVALRTPDELFNARFVIRSDHPMQARMFLASRGVMPALQRLCRLSQSFVLISSGQIEVGELAPPDSQAAKRALEYLESAGRLAQSMRAMPGAEAIKIEPLRRPRPWAMRVAVAVGLVVVIVALVLAAKPGKRPAPTAADVAVEGIPPSDAARIPGVTRWRLATADDFEGAALAWMHGVGAKAQTRIEGEFCADGGPGVAYLLVSPEQGRRVVVLCQGENVYDATFRFVGMMVRIPAAAARSIPWASRPPEDPSGDVLLITRTPEDPHSGLALFVRGHRVISGVPADYESIKLE